MKTFLAAFVVTAISWSCSLPSSSFEKPKQTGVDFSNGRWLLYNLDVPTDQIQKLENKVVNDFSKILDGRFTYCPNSKGLLIAQKIPMQPDKAVIRTIKKGMDYDYFINIKAQRITNDLGSVSSKQVSPYAGESSNSGYVEMEIYDLNSESIIYSQKVISSVTRSKSDDKVHFSKSSYQLLMTAYNKVFNDLKRKSILK
ncbi:MAG: hypothetical protein EOO50_13935 [Flavobacterium sp.]|uniref:hypothetical protein n=1 Tax=Flavobacterium sp. TaxID=239 RepID=UPI00121A872F|nr:hypothetical protein [Flavobacterium sp.]RZJ65418.1 MAG: hypothetical protein EOO50_13935 [Flavobacterium sp.]